MPKSPQKSADTSTAESISSAPSVTTSSSTLKSAASVKPATAPSAVTPSASDSPASRQKKTVNTAPDYTFIFVGDTEVGSRLSALLVTQGFMAAPSLKDADVVFTYHESQSGLEDIYFGTPGLLSDTKEEVVLIDLSPTTPVFAQELSALAQVNNRVSLDAPLVVKDITAQDAFASAHNLMIVAGGSESTYQKVLPLLQALAGRVSLMGAAGAGQAAKIALTLHNAAAVVGLVEADAFRVLSGSLFDAEDLLEEAVSAQCISPVHAAFLDALRNQSYQGTYSVEMMMGELSAALSAADDKDMIFPQAEAGFHLLELLAVVGGATFSPAALTLVFGSEETARQHGLDWSRAEEVYGHEHGHACDHDHEYEYDHGHDYEHVCDHDHAHNHDYADDFLEQDADGGGCECGHHHHDGHECCGKHHHSSHQNHHGANQQHVAAHRDQGEFSHEGQEASSTGFIGFSSN